MQAGRPHPSPGPRHSLGQSASQSEAHTLAHTHACTRDKVKATERSQCWRQNRLALYCWKYMHTQHTRDNVKHSLLHCKKQKILHNNKTYILKIIKLFLKLLLQHIFNNFSRYIKIFFFRYYNTRFVSNNMKYIVLEYWRIERNELIVVLVVVFPLRILSHWLWDWIASHP